MKFKFDMELGETEFRKQVENIINDARKNESALPLPIHVKDNFMEIAALVLGQINCEKCDARCCRSSTFAEFGIPFLSKEYENLVERVSEEKLVKIGVKLVGNSRYIPTPCPFLKKNTCLIYDIRPVVCVNYPLDSAAEDNQGEKVMSLNPLCPEARRIARRTYLTFWKLFHKSKEAYSQMDELEKGAQNEQRLRNLKSQFLL
ncbi:YkgJ family cysteine cluster protein [Chloroflexota bacterium]